MTLQKYTFLLAILIGIASCKPAIDDKIDIGEPPVASFEIIDGDTPNKFTLRNTSPDVFLTQWDLTALSSGTAEGEEIQIDANLAGTYDIIMTTFNRGGSASVTKQLVVTEDNPDACFGNMELLTGCGTKTWTLLQDEGALTVGPNADEIWWNNSLADVVDRDCHFNDRYTFTINGEYEFDTQGDFRADDDGGGNVYPPALGLAVGCHPESAWPADFAAWGAGTHEFEITNSTLKVIGEGAWMGLYKVGDQMEVTEPQQSITYTIDAITADRLELSMFYGTGIWSFVFVPE